MPEQQSAAGAIGATPAPHAAHDVASPNNQAPASPAIGGASDASAVPLAALANELAYTLTVGQARDYFARYGRRVPAERTLQHYCTEGTIAAQKIRTTYGAEWLINDASLLAYIEEQPIVTAATPAPHAAHDVASPNNHTPASAAIGGASDAGGASLAEVVYGGERRTLADVLVENARLLATIEGKDQVLRGKDETITELKDDRGFLRDELREARQQRQDVKEIASRMLDAMQTIAIAGKLPPAAARGGEIKAQFIEPDAATPNV